MSVIGVRANRLSDGADIAVDLAEETAIAITYDGTTQAVLMGSPADLEDFAYGFSLTEGIATPDEIDAVAPEQVENGIDLRVWLKPEAGQRYLGRRRRTVGPVGCGLCGVETLAAAMRALPQVSGACRISADALDTAVAAMDEGQALRDATGATHGAGFFLPGEGLVALREDVGRHNALDKLAGALLRAGYGPRIGDGAVVMTSRISVDLVQKTAILGAPVLIALAAPTSAAVSAAQGAGIGLAARARSSERAEIYARPDRFG
ncbi:formate dehydrogenase accessory sulfurtransferase FdhD [Paracoccus sediminicola]|uniref:formate dehydrogenase accessory sulfurtransferase FdhD n=1 Tax=Paracoccus sediminicola TaxID=3017783 RepID=UPI0022F04AB4|nr:formate dehydrogenase accessory sulfurtransferase FdhD [Paracoccus sediminicola]WBU57892.1 formate dehydrogenase accessory sulfurtransferase FdhD [Paracoccus sediminicola]